MKKLKSILCILLAALLLLLGCAPAEDPGESSSEIAEPELSLTERYPDPTPEELPKAATLMGSRHLPPITSQGTTDACAAYSSTYYQFTAAVSTYLAATGNTERSPASGNNEQIFSPRFPFLRSGQSITACYRALAQYGCLPISDCSFAVKDIPYLYGKDGKTPLPESSAWAVTAEENQKALAYRLTGHETVSLRETPFDDALLMKMKTALAVGNTIILSTEISGCQYSFIDRDGCGSYGKIGDQIVFASAKSGQILNHAITIIGYDDEITCTVNGHTFRGAFQCANSSSTEWKNSGYCWISYDAFRAESEWEGMNDPLLCNSGLYLDTTGLSRVKNLDDTAKIRFTKTGEAYEGEIKGLHGYPLYTISNCKGETLGMEPYFKRDRESKDIYWEGEPASFILLPVTEAKTLFDLDELPDSKGFLIIDGEGGFALSPYGDGNHADIQSYTLGTYVNYPAGYRMESSLLPFYILGYRADPDEFESVVYNTRYLTEATRVPLGFRLDFIDWRTDIAVGLPERWIEFTVTAADRGNILAVLQSGNSKVTLQGMNGKPIACLNTPLTFSGVKPDEAETGTFAVCLDGLKRKDGWRLTLGGEGVTLLSAKLLDGSGQLLCEKTAEGNAVTFEESYFQ